MKSVRAKGPMESGANMSNLQCDLSEQAHGLLLKLTGQFGYGEMEEFDKQTKRMASHNATLVVLDLSELKTITSAGIGALLRLKKSMDTRKCVLRMAALPANIEEVFKLSRLSEVIQIVASVDQAMN